jgi:circadian clock protein KaiB
MQEMERQEGDYRELINTSKKIVMVLYITGSAPRSISAINNITSICKNNLIDYELKIIDIYENPNLAKDDQIVAIPTLVRVLPPPIKRIIGDLTSTEKVLTFLKD